MSIYVVNVNEVVAQGQQAHRELRDLAQQFHGAIFHRDGSYGSFMVHESSIMSAAEQLEAIRAHFAKASYQIEEKISPGGHVIFNVDVTKAKPAP